MRRISVLLLITTWVACGGPEGGTWSSDEIGSQGFAATSSLYSRWKGCEGCDLTKDMCAGKDGNTGGGETGSWSLQCKAQADGCAAGEFRQCINPDDGSDCGFYRKCKADGTWGGCEKIPGTTGCGVGPNEGECPNPNSAMLVNWFGEDALTCGSEPGSSEDPPEEEDKGKLYIDKLDCEANRDGDEIECEVTVCLDEAEVTDSEVTVGLYFDASKPDCEERPTKDFALDDLGSGKCRDASYSWKVDDEDASSVRVYAAADVDCAVLEETDSNRTESQTVRLDSDSDGSDGSDSGGDTSAAKKNDDGHGLTMIRSSCQLAGAAPVDGALPLLLTLLALLRLRRRR